MDTEYCCYYYITVSTIPPRSQKIVSLTNYSQFTVLVCLKVEKMRQNPAPVCGDTKTSHMSCAGTRLTTCIIGINDSGMLMPQSLV